MSTPSITSAQLVGLATALGGLAVAFGVVDNPQRQAIVAAVTAATGIGLHIADAIIRHGRSRSLAGMQAAIVNRSTGTATPRSNVAVAAATEPSTTADTAAPAAATAAPQTG